MEKNSRRQWTKYRGFCIVTASLCLWADVLSQEPIENPRQGTPVKAEETVQAWRTRCLQSEAEAARLREQLGAARSDLAEALTELRQCRREVSQFRAHAALLLLGPDGPANAEVLTAWRRQQRRVTAVCKALRREADGLGRLIASVIALLDDKSRVALQQQLQGRLLLLRRRIADAEDVLTGPQRPAAEQNGRQATVLRVEAESGIVILDVGHRHGVRPGSFWRPAAAASKIRLRVVDIRTDLSAAIVTEGPLQSLTPGLTVRRTAPPEAETGP